MARQKLEIVKGTAFELDPNKSYLICIDLNSGITMHDVAELRKNMLMPNATAVLMVDGDPNNLVKIIEASNKELQT